MRIHRIYCATNRLTGMRYVGCTVQSMSVRKAGHLYAALKRNSTSPFHQAIRRHGWDAFDWEVLEECTDRAEALRLELRWIEKLGCRAINGTGYNFISTDPMGPMTETQKRKISETHKARGHKPPAKAHERAKAAHATAEFRKKVSESWKRRGPHVMTDEWRANTAARNRARAAAGLGCKIPPGDAERIVAWSKMPKVRLADIAAAYGVSNSAVCLYLQRHRQ